MTPEDAAREEFERQGLAFLMRFFRATQLEYCDCFLWRTDGGYAPLTVFANCSDLFVWACADCERVTLDNIDTLEKAIRECPDYAIDLFCCRVRGMRPQRACYRDYSPEVAALFDACGPERADES